MNIINTSIWGQVQREWGFEIRVDFTDDTGKIHNETLVFEKEPDDKMLKKRIEELKASVESRVPEVVSDISDSKDIEINELKTELNRVTVLLDAVVLEKELLIAEKVLLKELPVKEEIR